MKTAILILPILAFSLSSFALNELGAFDDARAKNPAIFVPGNVLEYAIEGVSGYVFNGEAEQCFSGNMAESDSELYQEAVLDAKSNLRKYLAKRTKSDAFQLSAVRKLYEYPDGKMRRVVLFVAKESVSALPAQSASASSKQVAVRPNRAVSVSNEKAREAQKTECRTGANETDCIAMSKAAKTYARQGNISEARVLYERIVKVVLADEKMDKAFASGLLMEAARFERDRGDVNRALKYYRLLVRCDGLRRWRLHELVDEANRNISSLLLKVD